MVVFLDGVQYPKIDFFGLDHDANVLGIKWRIYQDFGVAEDDYRVAVKSEA